MGTCSIKWSNKWGCILDLSAAFDLVSHEILMRKLKIYGVHNCFLQWIEDYMTGRQQSVWIDHCFSPFLPCGVGVPQGSILGPLIFLAFINDMSFNTESDIEQYADDTTLSTSSESVQEVSQILTENCAIVNK